MLAQSYSRDYQQAKQSSRRAQEIKRLDEKKAQYSARLIQHKPPLQATNPQDKVILERFYSSTDGNNWANNSGWMKGDPCMDYWYGIYCSESGRVLQINLVYNLLSGRLPTDLGRLDQLQVLRLYSNNIGGTIVSELFSMDSLEELDLEDNQISGSLPSAVEMSNITIINLYQNKLSGNIPRVWNTPKLTTLSLSSNMLEGSLPPSIGQITTLKVFVASRNTLTGTFPDEYGQLSNLQQLWLFSNNFNGSRIPTSWAGMSSLTSIELDGIHGDFPQFIGKSWPNLVTLVIVDGFMTGEFPESLCDLKYLQDLLLYNNSLKGDLPNCICNLPPSLSNLELSDNQFTGSIPDCLDSIHNLTNFILSRNNLSGLLPRSLGNCKLLEVIDVSGNGIYGSIPATYANLQGITVQLAVNYNKLSTVENGLENFFDFIKGYSCLMYNNPWDCPLPSFVPKECQATCSSCNSGSKHTSCVNCIADNDCGWCNEGGNCLEGSSSEGPDNYYPCKTSDWIYGSTAHCPT